MNAKGGPLIKGLLTKDRVRTTCSIRNLRILLCYQKTSHVNDAPHVNCDDIATRFHSSSEHVVTTYRQIHGTIPLHGKGVAIGQYAELPRRFTAKDVEQYADLSGDHNPLHRSWNIDKIPTELQDHVLLKLDENVPGSDSTSTKIVVHGMLVSSIFTCIFGTLIPGAIYMKQTLDFRRPVYVNDPVIGRVTITRVRNFSSRRGLVLTCETTVCSADNETQTFVRGEADVLILSGEMLH